MCFKMYFNSLPKSALSREILITVSMQTCIDYMSLICISCNLLKHRKVIYILYSYVLCNVAIGIYLKGSCMLYIEQKLDQYNAG